MFSEQQTAPVTDLIAALDDFAFRYPSLDPDDYTEWDTQEWFDEDIEEYAAVVGEVVERIHRREMRDADLYRTEARERAIGDGYFMYGPAIAVDDAARSYGPRAWRPR